MRATPLSLNVSPRLYMPPHPSLHTTAALNEAFCAAFNLRWQCEDK